MKNLEQLLLDHVEVIHGVKMVNMTDEEFEFVDTSGDFVEILKPNDFSEFAIFFASRGSIKANLDEFKSKHEDIILVGNLVQQKSYGPAISLPVLHRNRNSFKYYEFK